MHVYLYITLYIHTNAYIYIYIQSHINVFLYMYICYMTYISKQISSKSNKCPIDKLYLGPEMTDQCKYQPHIPNPNPRHIQQICFCGFPIMGAFVVHIAVVFAVH